MSAAGSYAPPNVDEPLAPSPLDQQPEAADALGAEGGPAPPLGERIDLTGLSIAGITKRRVGWVAAAFVSAWIVVVFARQVGEATDAANRADQLRFENSALAAEVEALEDELAMIVRDEYIAQQARAEQFGLPGEIPFALDRSVPLPPEGAPGSASAAQGADLQRTSPLESWLALLFGPAD